MRIPDNALVAMTLFIAESRAGEKDVPVRVVVNLINKKNTCGGSGRAGRTPCPSELGEFPTVRGYATADEWRRARRAVEMKTGGRGHPF